VARLWYELVYVRLYDLDHLDPMRYHCYDRLQQRPCSTGVRFAFDQLCRQSRDVYLPCVALRRLGQSVDYSDTSFYGGCWVFGLCFYDGNDSQMVAKLWYMAFAAFWVAIVSRKRTLQPRYYHSDFFLGPQDLGTLAFTLQLAKGDCSSSMRASDRHA
jgi:hypothetical protein